MLLANLPTEQITRETAIIHELMIFRIISTKNKLIVINKFQIQATIVIVTEQPGIVSEQFNNAFFLNM